MIKKENIILSFTYFKAFLKWIFSSVAVGILGGLLGSFFHISIEYVTHLRMDNPWIILLLPFGGILITALYTQGQRQGRIDTNRVIQSIRSQKSVPFVMMPLIFISTAITHLFGGSAGREGASLQLGGSLGYKLGKILRLKDNDLHIIVMSGMSAVFAAVFGTPVTAMIFCLEVTTVGVMQYAGLMPCAVSALIASQIAQMFNIAPVRFMNISFDVISAAIIVRVVILAVMCAALGIVFCLAIRKCEEYMKKVIPNSYLRAITGGVILVVFTLALRTTDYNGAGMEVISRAMQGEAKAWSFIIKILFTAITVAAGFKGGEIIPAFFVGATFGCTVGPLIGLDAGFGAAIGFVALFCGVVNCPVASIVLAAEVFGTQSIIVFALVCAISYMMSGYTSLYKSQKFIYSKLDDAYIDIDAK